MHDGNNLMMTRNFLCCAIAYVQLGYTYIQCFIIRPMCLCDFKKEEKEYGSKYILKEGRFNGYKRPSY
jgi:hypothetical protein